LDEGSLYGTAVSLTIWTKLSVPVCCKGQQLIPGWGLGAVEGAHDGQILVDSGRQSPTHLPSQEQGSQGALGQPQPQASGSSIGTSLSQGQAGTSVHRWRVGIWPCEGNQCLIPPWDGWIGLWGWSQAEGEPGHQPTCELM